MEFKKIILLTINGLSFIILLALFVFFLLERKKVKEKLTEETTRLEKIIDENYKQINNEIEVLKSELRKIEQNVVNSVEQVNTGIKSSENSIREDFEVVKSETKKYITGGVKLLNVEFNKKLDVFKDDLEGNLKFFRDELEGFIDKNFETLKLDIQHIGQDFENRIENLNKQMNESYNQLNIKVDKLEKLLKEPIDIEEWINESDR